MGIEKIKVLKERRVGRFISWIVSLTVAGLLLGVIFAAGIFYYYGAGLPDYKTLASYEPPVVSRLYSSDGKVFAEYAHEKRIYVPLDVVPTHVRNAFLSAEDKNFYTHFGIDIPSIIAAAITNLKRIGTSRRPIGASTITQQVAKNFLLTKISHMVSLERKIKEAILSLRIEKAYTKDYIFELYLNEVYLGSRSYGIAAAALNYFNKSLQELSIAEAAFFAALPKAPSRYHPKRNPKLTYARRNWVIDRMLIDGVITKEEAKQAKAEKIVLRKRNLSSVVKGNYFAEEVRRELIKTFGEKSVYQDGYVVRTTLDPRLQKIAEETLQEGLVTYDRNHGWRGAVGHISLKKEDASGEGEMAPWVTSLGTVVQPAGMGNWHLAIVLDVQKEAAQIGFSDGRTGYIPLAELKWARRWINDEARGDIVRHAKQVLKVGDVVLTDVLYEDLEKDKKDKKQKNAAPVKEEKHQEPVLAIHKGKQAFKLCQIPAVSGAIVAMDPITGRVLAMQGGYSFDLSQFNRATQAMRQTGSAFKPFSYIAAFEKGLTPSTVLEDTPLAIDLGYGLGIWRPKNWDEKFKGPITVRRSFELSRNVAAIRMVHEKVGMKNVVDVAKRFNVDRNMPVQLSGVLGASETTVLRLTAAYAMIANGGKLVAPSFFDHVQDRRGKTVLVNGYNLCTGCESQDPNELPFLRDLRPQVTDPVSAYQMTSLLRGAVERGLGRMMKSIPQQVVVKSGTTNDYRDAWMMGYSPTLVLGVYIGFDTPRTLGKKHYGSKVSGPVFKNFMERALKDSPVIPFKMPKGVKMVKVNAFTGGKAQGGEPNTIYEAFRPGTEVTQSYNVPQWDGEHEEAGEDGGEHSGEGGGYPQNAYGSAFAPMYPKTNSNTNPTSGQNASEGNRTGRGRSTTPYSSSPRGSSNSDDVSGTGGLY